VALSNCSGSVVAPMNRAAKHAPTRGFFMWGSPQMTG
jgi:hypothetical protein